MKILAIDPGNIESAYALIEMPEFKLLNFGKVENHTLKGQIEWLSDRADEIAIEMVACYGMPVGKDVFDTCVWIGRFTEKLDGKEITYIYRTQEKATICYDSRAKDSNIKQGLINRYAKHDFKRGKGTKGNPDTFYGVAKDVWQAIAVGVTHYETKDKE